MERAISNVKYENSPINQYFKDINIPEDIIIEEIKNYFKLSISGEPNIVITPSQQGFEFYNDPSMFNGGPVPRQKSPKSQNTSAIEKYTINYTKLAAEDKFDKIVGRESEILEMCETLCRRIKIIKCY